MKPDWSERKLGDLCRLRTGKKDVNEGNPNGEFPFFTCAAKHTFSDTYSFDTEALLIAGNGDVGQVSYYKGKFEAYQRTYVLSEFAGVIPRYLFLILEGKLKDTVSKQKLGNTMPYIKMGMLTEFIVPVPPLAEQRRIVGLLDEAFEGLATAKANAEKNLQNARALFESHLHSVFTHRGKRWVESTVGESCVLRSGTTLPKELEQSDGEVPYLKVADMNLAGNLDGVTCSSRYVNRSDVNASNLLPVGTTIFPKRGGAILTNKKRLTKRVICADLNIMGVIPGKTLLPELLFLYFLNVDMRELGSGSSIPQINNYDIEPLSISFPTLLSEQSRIVNELEALSEETQRLARIYERKLTALEALKKSLLHQAFNGEL